MSNMPRIEDVRAEHSMRIERVVVNKFPFQRKETLIDFVHPDGETSHAFANLYKVENRATQGYLPSKVWVSDSFSAGAKSEDIIEMSFYCTPSLPAAARPFGDGPMYVLWLEVSSWTTVDYDVEARVFIDQVLTGDRRVLYVFVFGEDQYNRIIAPTGE